MRKTAVTLFLILVIVQFLPAQEFSFKAKKLLTKTPDPCRDIDAAWNGKLWGVFYCVDEGGLNFLRVKKQGKILSTSTVFEGKQEVAYSTYDGIRACWGGNGWGIMVERIRWEDTVAHAEGISDSLVINREGLFGYVENTFCCLDAKGQLLGQPLYLNSRSDGALIWMGDYYLVYYSDKYANSIMCAKVNKQGNLLETPTVVTTLVSGNSISVYDAIATKNGIVVLYYVRNYSTKEDSTTLLTVGLNHQVIGKPLEIKTNRFPLRAVNLLWTGTDYLMSGAIVVPDKSSFNYLAGFGLLNSKGDWILEPDTEGDHKDRKGVPNIGITMGGDWLYHFYDLKHRKSCYTWGKTADGKSERPGSFFFKYGFDFRGKAVNVNNITGLFMVNDVSVNGKRFGKAYYRRFDIKHEGVPAPQFLEGKIHTVGGKKYALLTWRINGCYKITITGPGKTVKLPPYGYRVWPVNSSQASFRFRGKNAAGWLDTTLTVK